MEVDQLDAYLAASGGRHGPRFGQSVWTTFGDPQGETRALGEGAGLGSAWWIARLSLTGADRVRFLDGQCTQHVAARSVGEGGYGFVLEANGKVVSDVVFLVREDALLLEVPEQQRERLLGWLGKFAVLSDVVLEDQTAATRSLVLAGPRADEVLGGVAGTDDLPGPEYSCLETTLGGAAVLARRDRETGGPGFILRTAAADAGAVARALVGAGATLVGHDAFEARRVAHGRPRFGVELDATVLPKESGQEDRAVSYTKGCYCGQEVVARQHYLGNPRKRLVRLVVTGDVRTGDPVVSGDAVVGTLGGVAPDPDGECWLALAVLKGDDADRWVVRPEGRPEGAATARAT